MSRSDLKDRVFLEIATKLGELGTCDRAKVGAVITRDGRCISWGFNGAPPGLPHCEEKHGWSGAQWEIALKEHGCVNATHAEANALAYAARQGISTQDSTLYVIMSPCASCARLLIAAGIRRMVYGDTYRDQEGLRLLAEAGCKIERLELHGGVL